MTKSAWRANVLAMSTRIIAVRIGVKSAAMGIKKTASAIVNVSNEDGKKSQFMVV